MRDHKCLLFLHEFTMNKTKLLWYNLELSVNVFKAIPKPFHF